MINFHNAALTMKRWAEKRGESRKIQRMPHEANKQLSTLTLRDTKKIGRENGNSRKEMKRLLLFACECVEIEFDDESSKQK